MFDVLSLVETGGDLQAQDLGVETAARLRVIALESAVSERLRNIAAAGKAFVGEGCFPVACRVRAAMERAAWIVIFDFQRIAPGLPEIDRVSKVGLLRLGDLRKAVFSLVGFEIFPGGLDFLVAADTKAVMVVEGLLGSVGTTLVDDQAPVGIGVFYRRFARALRDDFRR